MDNPLVYILVLNWNLPEITINCINSILSSDYDNFRILVVDNGSTDDNFHQLLIKIGEIEEQGSVSVLRETTNQGFSRGMNVGIRAAIQNGADFILLLNNDTIVDKAMVRTMVDAMVKAPEIGVLGPIIYYMGTPDRVWFSGYHIPGKIYIIRRGYHLKQEGVILEEVDFVNGCGMMIRKKVIDDIGLLPEVYFMYYEDLEYCLKAKEWGWKLACHKSAKMWHAVSLSSNGMDSIHKEFLQLKSSIIFFRRNTKGFTKSINILLRLLQTGYFCLKSIIKGKLGLKTIQKYGNEFVK